MSTKRKDGLTDKQQRFIDEYLISFNATDAARRAGYKGNDNTLSVVGHENLRKPRIAKYVKRRLQASHMSSEELLERLGEIARGDHTGYIDENGQVDFKALKDDDMMHLIKEIRHTRTGMTVKFCDPQQAQALLAKHKGLLVDKSEVVNKGEIKLRIVREHERVHDPTESAPPQTAGD